MWPSFSCVFLLPAAADGPLLLRGLFSYPLHAVVFCTFTFHIKSVGQANLTIFPQIVSALEQVSSLEQYPQRSQYKRPNSKKNSFRGNYSWKYGKQRLSRKKRYHPQQCITIALGIFFCDSDISLTYQQNSHSLQNAVDLTTPANEEEHMNIK